MLGIPHWVLAVLPSLALLASVCAADGGIPNRSYSEAEVFKKISPQMSSRHLNQPSVINGYAVLAGNAEHEVWDISDPYNPVHLADMISNYAGGEAESHQVSYTRRGDTLYMVTISGRGIDIWDMTDTPHPVRVSELILPGINYGDVSGGIWGVTWQGNYIYAGATTNGLYVIDVHDPATPRHVSTLSQAELGGVAAGPSWALGNLLVITTPKTYAGVATVDISNPAQPRLLDALIPSGDSYIGGFYGTHAYLIGFRAFDVTTNPRAIVQTGSASTPGSEYMSFGDDHFFLGGLRGGSEGIWKYNMTSPSAITLEGRFVGRDTRWDDQFSCPVGNILLVADDQLVDNQYVGGIIVVHSADPDTTPPEVRYVNPPDGSQNQAVTTSIGVSLSDWPELTSVDPSSFIVRPIGGAPLAGTWSCTTTTLNFSPARPLDAATTYEIVLPAGGVTDLVGNPIAAEFRSEFTTTTQSGFPGNAEVEPVPPTELGQTTAFLAKNPLAGRTYRWKLFDESLLDGPAASHTYTEPGRYNVLLESWVDADQKIEAEDAELLGGVATASANAGYSGSGYADYPGGTGNGIAIRWQTSVGSAVSVPVTIRYANGSGANRPLNLVVNDGAPQLVDFPSPGGWSTYAEVSVPNVALAAGTNVLELRASAGSAGPNVDSITVHLPGVQDYVSTSFQHLVHRPLTPQPPTSSQAMCLDPENNLLWTVNSDAGTATAVDLDTLAKVREVKVGEHPETVARAPDGTIWIANRDSWNLSIVEPATGAIVSTVELPYASQPVGIAFAPNGESAYVTLQALGRLVKLDPGTRQIVSTLQIPSDSNGVRPQVRGLAISSDSAGIYVTRFISPSQQGQVYEISAASMTVARTIGLAPSAGPDTPMHARGIPNYLQTVAISPDGVRAWIPSKQDNIFRGGFRDGLALDHDVTVRAVASQIDLASGAEVAGERLDFDDRDRAHSVSFSPLGDLAFVSMPGNNHISVHNAYTRAEVTRVNCGTTPIASIIDTSRARLYVLNFLSRDLSVYDVADLLADGALVTPITQVPLVAAEPLSAQVLRGKILFYDATSTKLNSEHYMSCASCHIDGYQDGQVWDLTSLGEGLRNTIDLRGRAGTRHGRLHWSGNFDEVHDFENQIRNLGAGEGLMSNSSFNQGTRNTPLGNAKSGQSADLDALAAYVASLDRFDPSPYRNSDGSLTSQAIAGRQIFDTLRCFDCHGGKHFTDSRLGILHNVGTLKTSSGSRLGGALTGLDTPTLRGVWAGAPYLHDGSAATLRDVLTTANPNGLHGATSTLDSTEIDQLVAYLNQIDGSEPPADAPSGVGSPAYSTYTTNFPALSDPAETVDFDRDAHTNLAEYALGATDPTLVDDRPPQDSRIVTVGSQQYLAFSYLRLKGGVWENGVYRMGDLLYRPETTSDLKNWMPGVVELANPDGLASAPEHYEWATIGLSLADNPKAKFLRVSVQRAASSDD